MAFPTSPADGDLYNGYEYNSTLSAWKKRETKDWVLKWSGNHAATVTNNWGTGKYKILVGYNNTVAGGMSFVMDIEDTNQTYYSGKFIGSTVSDKVGAEYYMNQNNFRAANDGSYATGGLLKIWRWE